LRAENQRESRRETERSLKTKENQGEKLKGLLLFSLTSPSSCVEGWKPKRIKEKKQKGLLLFSLTSPPPVLRAENQRELRRETKRSSAVQPYLAFLLRWGLKTKENQEEIKNSLLMFFYNSGDEKICPMPPPPPPVKWAVLYSSCWIK
jgi:hypothetical protein